jgi:hypothetical protein
VLRRIFLSNIQDKRRLEKTTHYGTLNFIASLNNRHVNRITLGTFDERNM